MKREDTFYFAYITQIIIFQVFYWSGIQAWRFREKWTRHNESEGKITLWQLVHSAWIFADAIIDIWNPANKRGTQRNVGRECINNLVATLISPICVSMSNDNFVFSFASPSAENWIIENGGDFRTTMNMNGGLIGNLQINSPLLLIYREQ